MNNNLLIYLRTIVVDKICTILNKLMWIIFWVSWPKFWAILHLLMQVLFAHYFSLPILIFLAFDSIKEHYYHVLRLNCRLSE